MREPISGVVTESGRAFDIAIVDGLDLVDDLALDVRSRSPLR